MVPPAPKVPLTVVLNDGKVSVALPTGLNGVTDPHKAVQKLTPLTVVLTNAEFGVRLIVPPFRLKSMLSASAAAGSAKANSANKSTRLIFAPPTFLVVQLWGLSQSECGELLWLLRFSPSPTIYNAQIRFDLTHLSYQNWLLQQ